MEHTINVPLARKVLEYLEENPTDHRQNVWATMLAHGADYSEIRASYDIDQNEQLELGACGTTGCFAGWTAALAGHKVGTAGELAGVVLDLSTLDIMRDRRGAVMINRHTSDVVTAENYAREALGLTFGQAEALFEADNSRAGLREMLSEWTGGEIEAERLSG